MPQNTNIKSDHDALLERIAIAIEEKTGASPDEQTDRKSASGAMLERIAEAIENGTGGGGGSSDLFIVTLNVTYDEESKPVFSVDKTNAEIYEAYTAGKLCFLNYGTLVPLDYAEENYAQFIDKAIGGIFPLYSLVDNTYTLENNVLTTEYGGASVSLNFSFDCSLNDVILTVDSELTPEQIYSYAEAGHSVTFRWSVVDAGTRFYYSARAVTCQYNAPENRIICAMMPDGKILNFTEYNGKFRAIIPTN